MSLGHTAIPYLERLWHPTTGCSRNCPGCWAHGLVRNRLAGKMGGVYTFDPTFHPDRLADPLKARKPQVLGVGYFGDLFDPGISDEQLLQVFDVLRRDEGRDEPHTMILLTKCAGRLSNFLRRLRWCGSVPDGRLFLTAEPDDGPSVQLPGVPLNQWGVPELAGHLGRLLAHAWIGVSVTCQADADERVPHLLRTPAAHRWVSVEPMVGPVDLTRLPLLPPPADELDPRADLNALTGIVAGPDDRWPRLDLVIAGGYSGSQARYHPLHPAWARSLRDQCAAAGVVFNFKQWGEWTAIDQPWLQESPEQPGEGERWCNLAGGTGFHGEDVWRMRRVGANAAGRLLDGVLHDELPWRSGR